MGGTRGPRVRCRRAVWAALGVLGATLAAGPAQAGVAVSDDVRAAVDRAIAKVYPALVRIHSVSVYYGEGREVKGEAAGSGAILSPDGYVITNHHVAGRSKRLRCTLSDKRELEAVLVGTDALSDISVLKLKRPPGDDGKPFPAASFGNSDAVRVGDQVLAMGSPRAISQSVTLGIVSNTEMTMPSLMWPMTFRLDGEDTGSLVKWIGHDAQIFGGNSGGPLVNLQGEIVGINEISLGLGGAIPGNLAREVAEALIEEGEIRRSWLGLTVQPLLKNGTDRGGLVASVVAGSPADRAGLKPGDLLLSYDGRPVDIKYAEQLPPFNHAILGTPVGKKVSITYRRAGAERTLTAVTEPRGPAEGAESVIKGWGLTVQDLSRLAAHERKRDPHTGVLVSSVRPGAASAEAKPPLQPEDVIVAVGGRSVRTLAEMEDVHAELTKGKASPVPLLVSFERRTQKLLTVVKVGERVNQDRSAEATKAWIPVATQVLTPDLADALDLKGRTGVRITEVYFGAGTTAGLQVGDVVLALDGEAIAASQPEDVEVFPAMVRQYAVGAEVKLDVVRDGKATPVTLALSPSPPSTRELAEYRDLDFEFTARDLTFQDRKQQRLETAEQGALITGVENGGWAALAHLAVGDIVQSVDSQPVADTGALRTRMRLIAQARPERVVFFVRRGIHTLFIELEPDWETGRRASADAS